MNRVNVVLSPNDLGEIPGEDALYEGMLDAGWTDDPKDGRSVLLEDGREVPNPLPVAPPVGYNYEPSIMDRLSQMLDKRMAALLEAQALEESEAEANDFDIDEDEEIRSIYEISLHDEFPAIPAPAASSVVVVPAPISDVPPEAGAAGLGQS